MNSPIKTVIKFEIIRQLKKPSFWIAVLFMPILIGVVFLISFFAGMDNVDTTPEISEDTTVAITDDAGILPKDNPFNRYETEAEGVEAVKKGETELFFYIPKDFLETKKAEFYHISEGLEIFNFDGNYLKVILNQYSRQRVDAIDAMAIAGEYEIKDNKLTSTGEPSNALGKAIIPFAILAIYFIFMVMFGSRLLMTVVEEKENRISEMILTDVSSKHLIIGKIISMLALGAVQILVLVIPIIILLIINRDNPMISSIVGMIEIDPVSIISNIALFVLSILLFAAANTMVGVLVPTARDASQYIGPVIVASVFPLYFMQAFMATTPGIMVHFLTYFPLSAPVALMLRSAFGTLSPAELIIGLIEIAIFAAIILKLTISLFQKNAINFEVAKLKLFKK